MMFETYDIKPKEKSVITVEDKLILCPHCKTILWPITTDTEIELQYCCRLVYRSAELRGRQQAVLAEIDVGSRIEKAANEIDTIKERMRQLRLNTSLASQHQRVKPVVAIVNIAANSETTEIKE